MRGLERAVARMRELQQAAESFPDVAQKGARKALEGVKVRGHLISMNGPRARVQGPQARRVSVVVAGRMGRGAEAAIRGSLR